MEGNFPLQAEEKMPMKKPSRAMLYKCECLQSHIA
ncbi:hypothetical protein T11_15753 [Trichinella zimbabwensis]|uniref:Uncharacterized protein n=1 Tax=Trichinella zimbabwensis TaxID=268475 RepID=A0A0V1GBL7_9BILA|nr:hypothetical protein T11_15753 [Trichinella zimbabwensis]